MAWLTSLCEIFFPNLAYINKPWALDTWHIFTSTLAKLNPRCSLHDIFLKSYWVFAMVFGRTEYVWASKNKILLSLTALVPKIWHAFLSLLDGVPVLKWYLLSFKSGFLKSEAYQRLVIDLLQFFKELTHSVRHEDHSCLRNHCFTSFQKEPLWFVRMEW